MPRLFHRVLPVVVLLAACNLALPPAPSPQGVYPDEARQPTEPDSQTTSGPIAGLTNVHGTVTLAGQQLDLKAKDDYFLPTFVEVGPRETLTVAITNEGGFVHTFTSDALGVDVTIASGDYAEVEITLPEEGPVRYYCAFHEQVGMQGAFVFEDVEA